MKHIYLDNAATTATDLAVAAAVLASMTQAYGNPSSLHYFGQESRRAVALGRRQLADLLNARPEEIFYTSGGSESDNFALKGIAWANRQRGNHIITTEIEHHAVLHTCEWLEKQGFVITYLPVDADGRVSVESVAAAITEETILISVMFANNEVGTIEPIGEIGALAHERGIYFHTDAVQAVGHVPIDVEALHIDLLSLSGHKFYGPKGIGALYVRRGVRIEPFVLGGSQERNLRAGTENVPGIVGLGLAAVKAGEDLKGETARLVNLRDTLIEGVFEKIPDSKLNGVRAGRLPGNVNFSFAGVDGEALLVNLDLSGIAASSGSACAAGSVDPSHVLLALGLTKSLAASSLRLTLGRNNTMADVEAVLEILPSTVARLRRLAQPEKMK